jgi:glycosyltransferase involved in cell wall biosynthesis
MRVTLLVPTLNEADGLRQTLKSLPRKELEATGYDVDVLVIDGTSKDGTPDVARELGAQVVAEPRLGYGRAYKSGFERVTGDLIVTCDADATYPLERLPALLNEFRSKGLDFATVDRFTRMEKGSMSAKHRFGNWVLSTSLRTLFRVPVKDSQSGMWILTRQARDRLPLDRLSDGMAFSQEIKIEAFKHPRVAARELAGGYRPRVGEAKLSSWRDGFGNLGRLVRHRRQRSHWRNGQA